MRGGEWSSGRWSRLLGLLDEVVEEVVSDFEDALVSGSLEERIAFVVAAAREEGLWDVAAGAELLAAYVHALRIRVVSLNSKRGLGRARDEVLMELARLRRVVEGYSASSLDARRWKTGLSIR